MIRAVVDTNIFISAFTTKNISAPYLIYQAFKEQKFLLVTSPSILAEFEEVLNREKIVNYHKLTVEQRVEIMNIVVHLSYVILETMHFEKILIKQDPDDDKFLHAAIEANADYVVSGDHHVLNVREYKGIKIVTPQEFVQILDGK